MIGSVIEIKLIYFNLITELPARHGFYMPVKWKIILLNL